MHKVKKKISKSIQTGYLCGNCEYENVVRGDVLSKPICINCEKDELKQTWKNKVTTLTIIEPL